MVRACERWIALVAGFRNLWIKTQEYDEICPYGKPELLLHAASRRPRVPVGITKLKPEKPLPAWYHLSARRATQKEREEEASTMLDCWCYAGPMGRKMELGFYAAEAVADVWLAERFEEGFRRCGGVTYLLHASWHTMVICAVRVYIEIINWMYMFDTLYTYSCLIIFSWLPPESTYTHQHCIPKISIYDAVEAIFFLTFAASIVVVSAVWHVCRRMVLPVFFRQREGIYVSNFTLLCCAARKFVATLLSPLSFSFFLSLSQSLPVLPSFFDFPPLCQFQWDPLLVLVLVDRQMDG
jgi:hypothetical protein